MQRGALAAGLATTGVVLAALALAVSAAPALTGAYALVAAPLLGLPLALVVRGALRRADRAQAFLGVVVMVLLALGGISLGGIPLLLPALCLAAALAVTPRPVSG
jgi:hypothetical protein